MSQVMNFKELEIIKQKLTFDLFILIQCSLAKKETCKLYCKTGNSKYDNRRSK
jgi:hypothetical protein